jgi:serine/threonine protein kinase
LTDNRIRKIDVYIYRCTNKMASSLKIIPAQKRGQQLFKLFVKEGANVNTVRPGRRIREHFSPAETLILGNLNIGDSVQRDDDPSRTGTVTKKTRQKFAIDGGKSNQSPSMWSIVSGRSSRRPEGGETKKQVRNNEADRHNRRKTRYAAAAAAPREEEPLDLEQLRRYVVDDGATVRVRNNATGKEAVVTSVGKKTFRIEGSRGNQSPSKWTIVSVDDEDEFVASLPKRGGGRGGGGGSASGGLDLEQLRSYVDNGATVTVINNITKVDAVVASVGAKTFRIEGSRGNQSPSKWSILSVDEEDEPVLSLTRRGGRGGGGRVYRGKESKHQAEDSLAPPTKFKIKDVTKLLEKRARVQIQNSSTREIQEVTLKNIGYYPPDGGKWWLYQLDKEGAHGYHVKYRVPDERVRPKVQRVSPKKPLLKRVTTITVDRDCSAYFKGKLSRVIVTSATTFEADGETYTVLKKIGQGTYGLILKASRERDGLEVAVKFMFEPDFDAQRRELAMQYWLSCVLDNKKHPPGAAGVPDIYSISKFYANDPNHEDYLELLRGKNISKSLVGIMELLDGDLGAELGKTSTDEDKIPIVSQALSQVATLLDWVNKLSINPGFTHGDLHAGNVMFKRLGKGKYKFFIMDMGMSEVVHNGRRVKAPEHMYPERRSGASVRSGTKQFRNVGSRGNDLLMLCISVVEDFDKVHLDDLPELFEPLKAYFKTAPDKGFSDENKRYLLSRYDAVRRAKRNTRIPQKVRNALQSQKLKSDPKKSHQFQPYAYHEFEDPDSPYYLGVHPPGVWEKRDGSEIPWPLGTSVPSGHSVSDIPLFHYYGYDVADQDPKIDAIFSPANFLRKYIR